MTKINLIQNESALKGCIDAVSGSGFISLDTEFMREKTYYPLLCLIQSHTPSLEFCVDPLAIENMGSFTQILSDPDILKIMHSCRQDLEAFDQRINQPLNNVFDTQIAAAFCGYGEQVSYAALVESVCGVKLPKSHTRADWSKRPLSQGQLEYAMDDVRYLQRIQAFFSEQLDSLTRTTWFEDECQRIVDLRSYIIDPDEGWKRLKGGVKLPLNIQPCAKGLAIWREHRAQNKNRPREWILSTRALIDICFRQPANIDELSKIESLNKGVADHSGQQLLEILCEAQEAEGKTPIWGKHIPLDSDQKQLVKMIMKKMQEVAEDHQIGQSLLGNRRDVEDLVSGNHQSPLLQGWRYQLLGQLVEGELA